MLVIEISKESHASELGQELRQMLEVDAMRGLYLLLGMSFNEWSRSHG